MSLWKTLTLDDSSPVLDGTRCAVCATSSVYFTGRRCGMVFYCTLDHATSHSQSHQAFCAKYIKTLRRCRRRKARLENYPGNAKTPRGNLLKLLCYRLPRNRRTEKYIDACWTLFLVLAEMESPTSTSIKGQWRLSLEIEKIGISTRWYQNIYGPALLLRLGRDHLCLQEIKRAIMVFHASQFPTGDGPVWDLDEYGVDPFERWEWMESMWFLNATPYCPTLLLTQVVTTTMVKMRMANDLRTLTLAHKALSHRVPPEIYEHIVPSFQRAHASPAGERSCALPRPSWSFGRQISKTRSLDFVFLSTRWIRFSGSQYKIRI